jgi:D-serine deaminase-like pyridoxal phosphate-dependent protein
MIAVTKPTLILNKEQCLANISQMFEKAKKSNVHFRPHFKTHQSAYIGNWFRKLGIHSITVSSLTMAKYFSAYGWRDITVAFPVNILELNEISELAAGVSLNLIADSTDILPLIENAVNVPVGLFIEIDTGYHRTGIVWKEIAEIDAILEYILQSGKLRFKGFLTHSGHSYHAESIAEIADIYKDTVLKMNYLKDRYKENWPDLIISVGDTPTCSVIENLTDVDEIRPGNFVFFDLMQYSLGSCKLDQIAVAVACPVIGKSTQRNEIIIYGGAIHLSKDFLLKSNGERIYGYVVKFNDGPWSAPLPATFVSNLTQEHGIIRTSTEIIEQVKRGDILGILPVHSCLTVNLMKSFLTLEGETINY